MEEPLAIETENGRWQIHPGAENALNFEQGEVLLAAARKILPAAYSPYSKFKVGAAIQMEESEEIFTGCNIENASYGATMCAERTALFSAVAAGGRKIVALGLTLDSLDEPDLSRRSPCGICRQVLSEFASSDTLIFVDSGIRGEKTYTGDVLTMDDLLPWRFRLDD